MVVKENQNWPKLREYTAYFTLLEKKVKIVLNSKSYESLTGFDLK